MEMFRFLPLRFHCTQDGPDINTGALSYEERFVITSLVLTLWLRNFEKNFRSHSAITRNNVILLAVNIFYEISA